MAASRKGYVESWARCRLRALYDRRGPALKGLAKGMSWLAIVSHGMLWVLSADAGGPTAELGTATRKTTGLSVSGRTMKRYGQLGCWSALAT